MQAITKHIAIFTVIYVLIIIIGYLAFVGYSYLDGSYMHSVDYAHARMEAQHRVEQGVWTQQQADGWLHPQAQLFWQEVWTASHGYRTIAVIGFVIGIVLFGVIGYVRSLRSPYTKSNSTR